jgi:hypothetical protein
MIFEERVQLAKSYYEKNQKYCDIGVFLAGFFFDIFTLSGVDDLFNVSQQIIYLIILGIFLTLEIREEVLGAVYSERWKKVWKYKVLIIHFLLGSLLSLYTIFFFKSASFLASFLFIGIIIGLLVLNELPFVQNLGLSLRTVLFSLCVGSFLAIHLPLIFGFVGWVPFLLSMILGLLITYGMFWVLQKNKLPEQIRRLKSSFLIPAIVTFVMYTNMYGLGLVPPVPLSLKYIGIYHSVQKDGADFVLKYNRPWWKFWQNGAQTFLAKPNDQIIAFVKVFSPTSIKDQIRINWFFDDPKQGWIKWDSIPLNISGGREAGFRGYGLKSNYQAGDWKVIVSTSDDREIGRISFTVEPDTSLEPTEYKEDRF